MRVSDIAIYLNSLDELPQEEWNTYTIEAVGCMQPRNSSIHEKLIGLLSHADIDVIKKAIEALGKVDSYTDIIQTSLTPFLNHTNDDVVKITISALLSHDYDTAVQILTQFLSNPEINDSLREYTLQALQTAEKRMGSQLSRMSIIPENVNQHK